MPQRPSFGSPRAYARLEADATELAADSDDDDDDAAAATDETLAALQPFFDELKARLVVASRQKLRPSGSGVAVLLTVGEHSWLIDLRDGVPLESA
eukprot:2198239-Prymnesium_polylepis.1